MDDKKTEEFKWRTTQWKDGDIIKSRILAPKKVEKEQEKIKGYE